MQINSAAPINMTEEINADQSSQIPQAKYDSLKLSIDERTTSTANAAPFYNDDGLNLNLVNDFLQLYEFAPMGYITLDQSGTIKTMNQTAAGLLAINRDEVLGTNLAKYLHNSNSLSELLTKTQALGSTSVQANLVINDSKQDIRIESKLIANSKSVDSIIRLVLRDCSQDTQQVRNWKNKQHEHFLLHQQQVAVRTAAAIVHELNKPLAAISMFSEIALDQLDSMQEDHSELREIITDIFQQVQYAGHSLHRFAATLDKSIGQAESFDMQELISDALSLLQDEGYQDFSYNLLMATAPIEAFAIRTQVEEIICNLLRNAIEAVIPVKEPFAHIDINVQVISEQQKSVLIKLTDNGPGIAPELINKIFEPFFSQKTNGLGMGLSISKALAHANGGKLWAEPVNGKGAVFCLSLPVGG